MNGNVKVSDRTNEKVVGYNWKCEVNYIQFYGHTFRLYFLRNSQMENDDDLFEFLSQISTKIMIFDQNISTRFRLVILECKIIKALH